MSHFQVQMQEDFDFINRILLNIQAIYFCKPF